MRPRPPMRLLPWAPMFAAPALALAAYAFALGALLASQRDERRGGGALRSALRDVEMDAALAMDEAPPPTRAMPSGGEEASRATADARVEAAVRRAAAAEARAAEAEAAAEASREVARARRRSSSRGEAADDEGGDGASDSARIAKAARDAHLDARSATDSDDGWERMSSLAAAASCVRCGDDASRHGSGRYAAVPCGHWPLCAACATQPLDACAVCGQAVTLALLLRD